MKLLMDLFKDSSYWCAILNNTEDAIKSIKLIEIVLQNAILFFELLFESF